MNESDTTTDEAQAVAGLLGEFTGPEALIAAAEGIRDAGYTRWDAHSPFPVHGIDRAVGIRMTPLPWLVLAAGIAGAALALLMQWWTNAVDYPLILSGKPLFSLPANIPVTFELIVLLSALAAFGGALVLNNLPRLANPLLASNRFGRATTDAFFVFVEASDPKFDEATARELFQSLGAASVQLVHEPAGQRGLPKAFFAIGAVVLVLCLLPPLLIAKATYTQSESPRIHPIPDMDFQPKYKPQAASPLFADGRGNRPPVPGTVADGRLREDDHYFRGMVDGQPAKDFPLRVTSALVQRGQERYNIYCATCHGLVGQGDGITSQRAFEGTNPKWVKPLSLHNEFVRDQPVGKILNTITNGVRTMPAYGPQIPVEDRWAIVLYVRALQRTQNASIDDVPEELRDKLR